MQQNASIMQNYVSIMQHHAPIAHSITRTIIIDILSTFKTLHC